MKRVSLVMCLLAAGCAPLPCVLGSTWNGGCPLDTPGGRNQQTKDTEQCSSFGYAAGSAELARCRERFALQRAQTPMMFLQPAPAMQPPPAPIQLGPRSVTNCTPTFGGGMNCSTY